MARVADLLYATGLASVLAVLPIQVGVWRTANGADSSLWVLSGGIAALILPLAALPWGMVRVDAEVERQRRSLPPGRDRCLAP